MQRPAPASYRLTLRLFGPFDVRVEEQPLPRLRSSKTQWLLALLVLRHGREVARDWLAGTLWPESADSQARDYLRHCLTDLRHALGSEAYRLGSPTHQTLLLDLVGANVDVVAFDEAVAAAEGASLERAAALYHGPLLEGCTEEWVHQERQARERAYLETLEKLADDALSAEDSEKAAGYWRRVVAVDPFRESAQRGLMQALAASGDYSAVMHAYRDLRLLLHRELHVDPEPQTTALFQQIREKARSLAQPPATAPAALPPPAPDSRTLSSNLPLMVTSFIGREKEIAEIRALLGNTRLLTLTGAGGCGKTRLALQVGAELLDAYRDEVWLVELAALSDPGLVAQTVAGALGLREEADRPLETTLIDALRDRELLLVLDNCEHLLEACARLTDTLHRSCPKVRILVTSREALGIAGEHAYRVPSLSLPDMKEAQTSESLSHYEAVRLFIDRAAAMADFKVTNENAPALASICYRLDGIPLAIELAAARVRSLSAEDINSRLDQRFRLLTGGSRTALPRQQTLRSLIDWSYDLLDDWEKRLLCRLSVFAGGWTLAAAEAVCAGEGIEDWEILNLLTSLCDKSVVAVEPWGSSVRYRLLETVRQYARDRLIEGGGEEKWRERHLAYYLALAEAAEPQLQGPEQQAWMEQLETEHDNLRAVLEWSGAERLAVGLRLTGALWRFWSLHGHLSEGRERLSRALAGNSGGDPEIRARALSGAGRLANIQGDNAAARRLYEESLTICRELGNRHGIANALNGLGIVVYNQGDIAAARKLYEESLAICRELGNLPGIANALNNLGNVTYEQGDRETAMKLYDEGLAIYRELGNLHGIASVLNNLGNVAYEQGDGEAAQALYEESLAIYRELGHRRGIANVLGSVGKVAENQGDYAMARTLYEESLKLFRKMGDKLGLASSLERFASLVGNEGNAERAAQLWGATMAWRETTGVPLSLNEGHQYDRAIAAARQSLGEEEFSSARAAGRELTVDQAIEIALKHD